MCVWTGDKHVWINMCVWTGEGGVERGDKREEKKREEREEVFVPHVNTHQMVAYSEEHSTKK